MPAIPVPAVIGNSPSQYGPTINGVHIHGFYAADLVIPTLSAPFNVTHNLNIGANAVLRVSAYVIAGISGLPPVFSFPDANTLAIDPTGLGSITLRVVLERILLP